MNTTPEFTVERNPEDESDWKLIAATEPVRELFFNRKDLPPGDIILGIPAADILRAIDVLEAKEAVLAVYPNAVGEWIKSAGIYEVAKGPTDDDRVLAISVESVDEAWLDAAARLKASEIPVTFFKQVGGSDTDAAANLKAVQDWTPEVQALEPAPPMELETVNKLFLELSQITMATSAREAKLAEERDALKFALEVMRAQPLQDVVRLKNLLKNAEEQWEAESRINAKLHGRVARLHEELRKKDLHIARLSEAIATLALRSSF